MDGVDLYQSFLEIHRPQLVSSGVPEHFWKVLCQKLTAQIFDAGSAFSMLLVDYGDDIRAPEDPVWTVIVSKDDGIKATDPADIYLIDHAWTYRTDMARGQLQQIPGLAERMAGIMGIELNEDTSNFDLVDSVLKSMWRYNNMYSINAEGVSVEDRMPIWYIMDELGSGINHSSTPNCRIVPFIHLPENVTYSLLFPVADIKDMDKVTRDFVEGAAADSIQERRALLLPWEYTNFVGEPFTQNEPFVDYFLEGHIEESLPDEDTQVPDIDRNRPLRVFSQYELINEFLTDPAFEVVTDETQADILWYTKHFKGFKEFADDHPNRFVNQFPFENVITIKDLLSIVCRRAATNQDPDAETLETYPKWLPTTFNLKTELVKFVSYFQNRSRKGLDNHWICKPWNLARGLDMHITNDMSYLMRLPATGPKIAQKYIEHPVLFDRPEVGGPVKFDVRYVILLKSTQPLEAYIYKNFFLRFANKPFELAHFDDYEQHFTVMNYSEFNLRHIPCAEFLEVWSEQYPKMAWADVETDICKMLREVLEASTKKSPPTGIGASPQSRAIYAADIMLAWENGKIQPKLLEINWVPDCKRACNYYPEFFNDIFKLLFLDLTNENVFRPIE